MGNVAAQGSEGGAGINRLPFCFQVLGSATVAGGTGWALAFGQAMFVCRREAKRRFVVWGSPSNFSQDHYRRQALIGDGVSGKRSEDVIHRRTHAGMLGPSYVNLSLLFQWQDCWWIKDRRGIEGLPGLAFLGV